MATGYSQTQNNNRIEISKVITDEDTTGIQQRRLQLTML